MKSEIIFEQEPFYIFQWSPEVYVDTFHWHNALEIGYCLKGKGTFFFGEKVYEVSPGDVFVVNNLERHIAQSDSQQPCTFLFLYLEPGWIELENPELLIPFVYPPASF